MTGRSWSLREVQLMTVAERPREWHDGVCRAGVAPGDVAWQRGACWTGICERWQERSLAARVPPRTVVPLMEEARSDPFPFRPVQIRRRVIAGPIFELSAVPPAR